MTADYGMRAAMALNDILPGQHRDKIVARMFNCSLRMAKYLRKGQYWTTDRLTQASVELGAVFDLAIAGQQPNLQDIAERLARLEERLDAQVGNQENQGLAYEQGQSVSGGSRASEVGIGALAQRQAAGLEGDASRHAVGGEAPLVANRRGAT